MTAETLLVIFTGVTALAFTLQCIAIAFAARSVRRLSRQVQSQRKQIEGNLETVQNRLVALSEDLQPLRTSAEEIVGGLSEVSQALKSRAQDVDEFLDEVLTLSREQASKVDYLVTDTVQKFEETTTLIQKDVLRPAVEISSFVTGIKAGLDVLLKRKPASSPGAAQSDEELFI